MPRHSQRGKSTHDVVVLAAHNVRGTLVAGTEADARDWAAVLPKQKVDAVDDDSEQSQDLCALR